MKFQVIPVTPYQQNCTLMWCEETMKAAVVDPGGDLELIEKVVKEQGVELEKILITHAHLDHVGGVALLAKNRNLPIEGPQIEDKFWIDQLPDQAKMMQFPAVEVFEPTRWLNQNDTVTVGNEVLEVRHCPGHTPGHVVFFHAPSKVAIVGDVLFQGSIGRTDFPRGDYQTLIDSIQRELWPLGDDVQFIPGHGPFSTFGDERKHNPFVADMNLKQ